MAAHLPEFLWEPAITHAAYVRNRSYTQSIPSHTPYQGWNTNKPNVSHLREFGTPVHILLQGQQTQHKILPKTHQHFYVGNKDNSNSIIYYSKETRRLNVSRNYYFINDNHPNVHITDPVHEGEWPGEATHTRLNASKINNQDINAQNRKEMPTQIPTIDKGSNEIKIPQKHTHNIIEPTDKDEPRKTRGIKRDYQLLDDSYADMDNPEMEVEFTELINIAEAGDKFHSLNEAKDSPDWPEWEHAI